MLILNKSTLFLSASLFSCFCVSSASSFSRSHSSNSSNPVKSPPPPYVSPGFTSVTTTYFSLHRSASNQNSNIPNNINASDVRLLTTPNGLQTDDAINPFPDFRSSTSVSHEPKGTAKDETRRRQERSPERWRLFKEERDLWDHERKNMWARQTVKEVEDFKKKEEEAGEEIFKYDGPLSSSSSSSSSSASSSGIQSPHDLLRHQRKELELFLWKQHSGGLRDERERARGDTLKEKDKEDKKGKDENGRDRDEEDLGVKTYLGLQAQWKDEDLLKEEREREVEVKKEVEKKIEKPSDDDYDVNDYASSNSDDGDDYGIEEYLDSYQYDYDDEEGDKQEEEENEEDEEDDEGVAELKKEEEDGRRRITGIDGLRDKEKTKISELDLSNWEESALEEMRGYPQDWQGEKKKEKDKEEEDSRRERKEEKRETLERNPPHIILIVADDLGYNDVPWHNPEVVAPNVEQLAREGTVIENHYVLPVCTPSRSALLSGVYPFRYGRQMGMVRPLSPTGLNTSLILLPQRLQELGYRTHLVGKWHLGYCHPAYTPTHRGFDSFYGFYLGSQTYYSHFRSTSGRKGLFGSGEVQDMEVAEEQLKKEKTKAEDWRGRLQDSRAKEESEKAKARGQRFGNLQHQEKKTPEASDWSPTHNNHAPRSWGAFSASSRSKRSSFFPSSSSKDSKKFVNDRPEWKRKWAETKMKEHLLWRTTKSKIEELLREKESAKLADGLQTRRKIEMRMRGGYDFRSNDEPLTNVTGVYSTHLFRNRATQLINEHARLYRSPEQSFSTYDRPALPLDRFEDDHEERNRPMNNDYPFRNYYLFDKSNNGELTQDDEFEFSKRSSGRETSERAFKSREPLSSEYFRKEINENLRESSMPPMFLMLSFQAVHSPLQVPPKYKKKLMNIPNTARRQFLGMVAAMDEAVGKVVDALKSNNMYENSVIVFTSDNGGSVSSGGNNFPLRGSKGGLFEGGTRGVAFIHSPLLRKKGQKYYGLMHAVDWYDTLLHVAEGRHQTNHQSPDRSQSKVHPLSSSGYKKPLRHQSRDHAKSRNQSRNKAHIRPQKNRYKKQRPSNSEKYTHKTHGLKKINSHSKKENKETRGKQVESRQSRLDEELLRAKSIRERDYEPQMESKPLENSMGSRYTKRDSRSQDLSRGDLRGESSKKIVHNSTKENKEKQGSAFNTEWNPRLRERNRKHWFQKDGDISEQDRRERGVKKQKQQSELKENMNYDGWSSYYDDYADVKSGEQPPEIWDTVHNYDEKNQEKGENEKQIRSWRDIDEKGTGEGKLLEWWKTFIEEEEEGVEWRTKRDIQEHMKEEVIQMKVMHAPTKQEYLEDGLNEDYEIQDDYRIYQGLGIDKKGMKGKKSRFTAITASLRQEEEEEQAREEEKKRKGKETEEDLEEDEDDDEDDDEKKLMGSEQEAAEEEDETEWEEDADLEGEEGLELELEEEVEKEEKVRSDEDSGIYERQGRRNKRDTMDLYQYMRDKADRQRGYRTDGYDMWSALSNNQPSPRSSFVYNVRKGPLKGALRQRHWKLVVGTGGRLDGWIPPEDVRNDRGRLGPSWLSKKPHNKKILLFNLKSDPLETTDVSEDNPEVVKRLRKVLRSYAKESQKTHAPEDDPRGHPSFFGGFFSPGWCEPIV